MASPANIARITPPSPAKKLPDVAAEMLQSGKLSLSFSNGAVLELDPATLTPEMQKTAMLHGLKQKLVDAAAIGRDMVTGRSATIQDKYNAVREVFDRITGANGEAPSWNKVRDAGTNVSGGLLVSALMQMSGKDRQQITTFLAGKTNEEKAALRKNQKVAEIIAQLQAAKTKTDTVDSDGLLGQLMGAPDSGTGDDGQDPDDGTEYVDEDGNPCDIDGNPLPENTTIALD